MIGETIDATIDKARAAYAHGVIAQGEALDVLIHCPRKKPATLTLG
ncbi:MAG: hypothetical protein WDN46_04850 [Methylocella sp.]